ncbi:MAG: ATP-binding protein [Rhodocyclaceae bacterium]|nr:ATP-binding protein [Rhodocyclaceae bacterium]
MPLVIIQRTIQDTIQNVSAAFPVLLLTGPRQVGKTTALQACAEKSRRYISLDDPEQRDLARSDPALFLQVNPPPILIDEIQYAPGVFGQIKILVDRSRQPGMFWLTGSQKFHLMKGVAETLAGRIAILDLLGLSQAEIEGRAEMSRPFIPTTAWLAQTRQTLLQQGLPPKSAPELYRAIWRGSFPEIALNDAMPRDVFFRSYLQTYLQRDVRDLTRVGDESAFLRFLRTAAARTGQLLNYADLSRDADVDQKTGKAWLSILETSGLVYLLQPYHSNLTKRLIKTPKLYFLDTGLAAYITQWSSPESLEAGAMSGAILETWFVAEILKSHWHRGLSPNLFFYRDKDQKEVDLIIERDDILYPVEFKKSAAPGKMASKNFQTLSKLGKQIGPGAVLCLRETDIPLSAEVTAIPASFL